MRTFSFKYPLLLTEDRKISVDYGNLRLDKGDLRLEDEEWRIKISKLRVEGFGLRMDNYDLMSPSSHTNICYTYLFLSTFAADSAILKIF